VAWRRDSASSRGCKGAGGERCLSDAGDTLGRTCLRSSISRRDYRIDRLDWEAVPEYKNSLERALGKEEAARLNEVVAPRLDTFGSAARRLCDNFSAILTRSAKQYRDRGLPKRSNELR